MSIFSVSMAQSITYTGTFRRSDVEDVLTDYYGDGEPSLADMPDKEIAALLKEAIESGELDILAEHLDESDSGTGDVSVRW